MAEAVSHSFAGKEQPGCPWVGRSIPRVEDAALLTGRGRFIGALTVLASLERSLLARTPFRLRLIEAKPTNRLKT